jgi:hypothetical protein
VFWAHNEVRRAKLLTQVLTSAICFNEIYIAIFIISPGVGVSREKHDSILETNMRLTSIFKNIFATDEKVWFFSAKSYYFKNGGR